MFPSIIIHQCLLMCRSQFLQKSLHLLVTIKLFPRMPPSSTSLVKLHQLLHLLAVVKLQGSPPIFPVKPTSVLWGNKLGLKRSGNALVCLNRKVIYISLSTGTSEDVRRQVISLLKCFFFYYQPYNKIIGMIQQQSCHSYRYLLKVNNKSILSEWLSFSC